MVAPAEPSGRVPTAAQFVRERYGGPLTARFRRVTVGTTVTEILPNNPNRVHAVIMNRSVNFGSFAPDREVTVANGILLGANGGSVTLDVLEDGEAVAWAWHGVNDTASGTWVVYEVMRV